MGKPVPFPVNNMSSVLTSLLFEVSSPGRQARRKPPGPRPSQHKSGILPRRGNRFFQRHPDPSWSERTRVDGPFVLPPFFLPAHSHRPRASASRCFISLSNVKNFPPPPQPSHFILVVGTFSLNNTKPITRDITTIGWYPPLSRSSSVGPF